MVNVTNRQDMMKELMIQHHLCVCESRKEKDGERIPPPEKIAVHFPSATQLRSAGHQWRPGDRERRPQASLRSDYRPPTAQRDSRGSSHGQRQGLLGTEGNLLGCVALEEEENKAGGKNTLKSVGDDHAVLIPIKTYPRSV
ncbi:hypothetical protein RRG08_062506 [Elysia crispata]|uniref:Uncharacterized protein n=1 Tax=Elysia crispata TaxID=231223 RepID=A0AAE0ZYM6_9GAST|nr:hypothetical protein RRG08_062506 [Elysia crispata]